MTTATATISPAVLVGPNPYSAHFPIALWVLEPDGTTYILSAFAEQADAREYVDSTDISEVING